MSFDVVQLLRQAPSTRDIGWLRSTLQAAIELELATLPPYLTARWTIKSGTDPVARTIREITREEMLHMGLACNLLAAVGGMPIINTPEVQPTFPGPLPGNVNPALIITLRRLTRDQVKVFMDIEYPQGGPITRATPVDTIGEFYSAIAAAFDTLNPTLDETRQLEGPLGLAKIRTLTEVQEAISLIKQQGEGSQTSPEDTGPGDLAHYYRFGEVYNGRRLVKNMTTSQWEFTGDTIALPEVWPMADIPAGGYQPDDVPDNTVQTVLVEFDRIYTAVLDQLQEAWSTLNRGKLSDAVSTMFDLRGSAVELMQHTLPNSSETYGPCFRLLR